MTNQVAPSGRTTVVIDSATFRRLSRLGRENERSASAEARLAIRRHLEDAEHSGREKAAA